MLEQLGFFWNLDTGIVRSQLSQVESAKNVPHAVIISELRRAGKSTLLAQMAHRLGSDRFYYVSFEDDRFLGFQADDANDLYQILVEVFGERKIFIIDEVQNITGWEHFARRWTFLIAPRKMGWNRISTRFERQADSLCGAAFCCCDVWDALPSDRPYRPAWTREQTIAYIFDQSGKRFDPEIVKQFDELPGRIGKFNGVKSVFSADLRLFMKQASTMESFSGADG